MSSPSIPIYCDPLMYFTDERTLNVKSLPLCQLFTVLILCVIYKYSRHLFYFDVIVYPVRPNHTPPLLTPHTVKIYPTVPSGMTLRKFVSGRYSRTWDVYTSPLRLRNSVLTRTLQTPCRSNHFNITIFVYKIRPPLIYLTKMETDLTKIRWTKSWFMFISRNPLVSFLVNKGLKPHNHVTSGPYRGISSTDTFLPT